MQISTLKVKSVKSKASNSPDEFDLISQLKRPRLNSRGFTLIEILTSLLLISLTFGLISTGVSTSRDLLEAAQKEIERAIAFSIDESTIRNSIVRVHFAFDDQHQELSVESGEAGNYTLPKFLFIGSSDFEFDLSPEELKKRQAKLKNSFQMVKGFMDSKYLFEPEIRIIGVASSISRQLVTEGDAAIYFYPTGEKDDALVIIGSDEELIAIKLSAFLLKIESEYTTLELLPEDDIQDKQLELAKEIFEKWLKER